MNRAVNTGSVPRDHVSETGVRGYSSELRSKQSELTRELILQATSDAVAEDPLLGFSMQEVARRAGVSLRSVYRHFPGRRQLFEALYDWSSERIGVPSVVDAIRTLDDLPPVARELFARFESELPVVRAGVLASLALGTSPSLRSDWDAATADVFRNALPGLDPEQSRRGYAMLRLLFTSRVWLTLLDRFGLDTPSAAEAVEWAAEALVADLRRRNAEQTGPKSKEGGSR